jgi:hypothetical protein
MKKSFKIKVKNLISLGLDARTAISLIKEEEIRNNLKFNQRINKEPSLEHFTKFDGTQLR